MLCDSIGCSFPGSSVHGILQARISEWVAIPFSKGSSQPREGTQASCIAGRLFIVWATREAWASPQFCVCFCTCLTAWPQQLMHTSVLCLLLGLTPGLNFTLTFDLAISGCLPAWWPKCWLSAWILLSPLLVNWSCLGPRPHHFSVCPLP